jgi:hypothetical protein
MEKMKNLLILLILIVSWQKVNSQCFSDRHSTNWFDEWVSCETSANPNSAYGNTHWILYDFGYMYTLFDLKIWNANEPNHLDYGVQDYLLDYSTDGINWLNLGSYTLNQSNGLSIYEGEMGPNFEGINARYMLITPQSNFGGACFALSEIKVYVDENAASIIDEEFGFTYQAYPNPFSDILNIIINIKEPDTYLKLSVYDLLGREIYQEIINEIKEINSITYDGKNLTSGIYLVKITHNNKSQTLKIVKK